MPALESAHAVAIVEKLAPKMEKRKLLIPFITAGYPSRTGCRDLLRACAAGGADRIAYESLIPTAFTVPLFDGFMKRIIPKP